MILQCSHPVSLLRPGTQGLIKLGFNTFCLSYQVFKNCLLFVLYRKEAAISWQGKCFPGLFWLFLFLFYCGSCLYSLKSVEDTHISSLLSYSPRPPPEGKVPCCLCVRKHGTCPRDTVTFLTPPFSQLCRPLGEHLPKMQKPPLPPATERHDRGTPLPGKKPPVPR